MKNQKLYDRLLQKVSVDKQTGCWNWTGSCYDKRKYPGHRYGYLSFWDKERRVSRCRVVHRWMWVALHGEPAPEICVLHTCDNVKCCNPDHLWLGTRKENTLDMVKKNRHHLKRLTHCKRGHKLYGDNLYVDSKGYRHCRECCRARQRAAWRSKPEPLRRRQYDRRNQLRAIVSASADPKA